MAMKSNYTTPRDTTIDEVIDDKDVIDEGTFRSKSCSAAIDTLPLSQVQG